MPDGFLVFYVGFKSRFAELLNQWWGFIVAQMVSGYHDNFFYQGKIKKLRFKCRTEP
jgi:hypothetical protein